MFYAHNMIGPSGFFLPDIDGSTLTYSNRLELIHSSEEGFNELYRGSKNGRFFVYKALKKQYRGNSLYEELLKKDFNIGFSLSHTGICQYYGMIDYPSLGNCIVMEWIDGRTLENLINDGHADSRLVRKIICELCDALDYIHKKQIIHRDLKPENIMITDNGNNVKIIDFGFSDADSYCSFKAPAGTKAYASPELLAGENIDARSDIWSLGVIINELSGRYRHVSSRCLRRDKEKRYSSTAEVKKAVLHESARKIRNLTTIAAVLITAAAVLYTLYINKEPAIPETMHVETEATTAITDTVKTDPAPVPAEVPDEATKRKAPTSEVPQDNSSESLDADALDDLFKDAAELIL